MENLVSLAGDTTVISEFDQDAGSVSFVCVIRNFPDALAGQTVRLRLGKRTLMTAKLPAAMGKNPLKFGPVAQPIDQLKRLTEFALTLRIDDTDDVAPVTATEGEFLEAASISGEDHFFKRVQEHFSRFKSGDLLVVGARAAYHNINDFYVRAAALTIQVHRLFEMPMDQLAAFDPATVEEILTKAAEIVREGEAMIASVEVPDWRAVRWTTSLATVGGNLALSINDSVRARSFYRSAARNTPLVKISMVSALNCINGCFFAGTLAAFAGDKAEARELLELGVTGFKVCVEPQDLLRNVWVIGDLINVARASRQCFIALARLNLLDGDLAQRIDGGSKIELGAVKSPVLAMVRSGLCPTYAGHLKTIEG